MTCDPLDRICLPLWVGVSDKTSSDPTDTFMGSNFPTFPFALPTGGAEPLSVSHVYPPKVNSLGPVIEEDPVPEVPVPEVPVPVPLPEPLLEVAPLEPLWAGVRGMVPPPHPTRENTANTKTHVLSIERSF